MSTIAILTDIHANLPALEAVLADVRTSGAERIVFLGDIVGYGASPAECVDRVRATGGKCVMGNHDVEIANVRKRGCTFRDPDWRESGYLAGLAHAARCLDANQAAWLAALPYQMRIPGAHAALASLDEPGAFPYIDGAESAAPTLHLLCEMQSKTGFFGHTHRAGIFSDDDSSLEWLDGSRVRIPEGLACAVTVAAVGRPGTRTELRAGWALWEPASRTVEFRHTSYDRLRAARDIVNAGLPLDSARMLLSPAEINDFLSDINPERSGP